MGLHRHAVPVDERTREVVDAYWSAALELDQASLSSNSTHVVIGEADEVVSIHMSSACAVRVPRQLAERAQTIFSGLTADDAFALSPLQQLVGTRAHVHGPSWHHYGDKQSLSTAPHPSAHQVDGRDPELLRFLQTNSDEDCAESGFPEKPSEAWADETTFHVFRQEGDIVAAGNMTEWRGLPADVGVLVHSSKRGQGHAFQLASAMIDEALPRVGVVRYRALSTNRASLAVAQRLGFERYGGNYIARAEPT